MSWTGWMRSRAFFAQQGANRFRVRAYRHAAGVLRGWPRSVADICRNHDIDESYARGIARQALKLDSLPDIGTLGTKSLVIILRVLRIHSRRPSHAVSLSKDGPTLSIGRSQRPQRQPSRQPSH